jgi:aryl-alcohol dehydrogenase-like predicted oxidoreductase
MRKRPLGQTKIEVSELGLGTWGLSGDAYGPVNEREQDAVIDRALALGINLFETADVYGTGKMERKLGARLPETGTIVVTKIGTALSDKPARKRFDVEYLKQSLGGCQERLGRKQLDVVLLHNPSSEVVKDGKAAEFLEAQVQQGALRAWGMSVGGSAIAADALRVNPCPQILQMPYNVFFSTDVQAMDSIFHVKKVGLLARSVLAHGLLSGLWSKDIQFDESDHRRDRWTPQQLRRRLSQLQVFNTLNRDKTPSMRAAAVNWVLADRYVSSAVLGPRSVLQLDQLLREVRREPPYFDPMEQNRLAQRLKDMNV